MILLDTYYHRYLTQVSAETLSSPLHRQMDDFNIYWLAKIFTIVHVYSQEYEEKNGCLKASTDERYS